MKIVKISYYVVNMMIDSFFQNLMNGLIIAFATYMSLIINVSIITINHSLMGDLITF